MAKAKNTAPSEPTSGQDAEMFIGRKWERCRVVSVVELPSASGQVLKKFWCRFPCGVHLPCGRNSIRAVK